MRSEPPKSSAAPSGRRTGAHDAGNAPRARSGAIAATVACASSAAGITTPTAPSRRSDGAFPRNSTMPVGPMAPRVQPGAQADAQPEEHQHARQRDEPPDVGHG